MIGPGLKKYAQELGMKVSNGVAYGSVQGFAVTFSEGAGYKQIFIATTFPDAQRKEELRHQISQLNPSKEYRVQKLGFAETGVVIVFTDNIGTMKKIRAFMEQFMPMLAGSGATGSHICAECGMEVTAGKWVLINGCAYYMHDACALKAAREIEEDNTKRNEADAGSYVTGTIGALLGATLGAVVWALVLNLGYIASMVGLLMGWLAEKGYNLLKGRQGKAKVAILIIAVILGVLLGNIGADVFALVEMIGAGELPEVGYGDIPALIVMMFTLDAEYRGAVIGDVLMGLLFAGLGVFSLLRKAGHEVADQKFVVLE